MIKIHNFEKALQQYTDNGVHYVVRSFDGWKVASVNVLKNRYSIQMRNENEYITINLYKDSVEVYPIDGGPLYKIEFFDMAGFVIYEHLVHLNWLKKPPLNFLIRIGEVINEFVIRSPNYLSHP